MAYQGAYGSTMPTQGQGHWYDLLKSLLSGLQGAGRGIGQGVGAVGQGAASALSSVGPQLPEILKILGSIGKGVGQTATMVGRQLPYAGPLIQAGEYGILNAVGKEDSPWAQGNAFVQRDVEQEQRKKMAELMQAAQELKNTGAGQENTQREWESTQNPFTQRKNAADATTAETNIKTADANLAIATDKLDYLKRQAVLNPADARIAKEIQLQEIEVNQARENFRLTGAQIKTQNAYANKANAWEPSNKPPMTANQIEANAKRYADTHTPGMVPGLDPPMQDKAVFEEWQRNVILYKQSVAQGIDIDTGLPYAGGTATNQGLLPPGGTANLPPPPPAIGKTAEQQLADFEAELGDYPNMTPEEVFISHRNDFDLADPEDLRAMKLVKDKYGIR